MIHIHAGVDNGHDCRDGVIRRIGINFQRIDIDVVRSGIHPQNIITAIFVTKHVIVFLPGIVHSPLLIIVRIIGSVVQFRDGIEFDIYHVGKFKIGVFQVIRVHPGWDINEKHVAKCLGMMIGNFHRIQIFLPADSESTIDRIEIIEADRNGIGLVTRNDGFGIAVYFNDQAIRRK